MATINYKCDTCKREVELLENKFGFTTFSNCTITRNCRGNLFKVKRNPNNIRQSIPKYDRELDDYYPRRLFYRHDQLVDSITWNVTHGFGSSCVFTVYDMNGAVIDPDMYTLSHTVGETAITFDTEISGYVHVLSRTGGSNVLNSAAIMVGPIQVSYNGVLTLAIPKYITRINSGSAPLLPPAAVVVTPTSSATPLPTATPAPTPSPSVTPDAGQEAKQRAAPFDICSAVIRIEIEVTKPNEPTVVCTETLNYALDAKSPWLGWTQILVKNRKHYCLRSINIADLKVFTNTNSQKLIIPDGTIMRITRIDYGTGLLVNIPDRGLLVLLSNPPHNVTDKELGKVIDCGEMVNSHISHFSFNEFDLYADEDVVETTYPKINRYRI